MLRAVWALGRVCMFHCSCETGRSASSRRTTRKAWTPVSPTRTFALPRRLLLESPSPSIYQSGSQVMRRAATTQLRELVVTTLHDVRRLAVELRPKALDDFGLVPALERLVETFRDQTGMQVELEPRLGDERLPSDVETTLYRITQEALTNVVKHAHAKHVSI